jgi:hypothetical protein
MCAKILRQNMQQTVLGFLKVNIELLLLFLVEIIEIKERAPGQTSTPKGPELRTSDWPTKGRRPESVHQLDHPFLPLCVARRHGGMVELASKFDLVMHQYIIAVCLVVV